MNQCSFLLFSGLSFSEGMVTNTRITAKSQFTLDDVLNTLSRDMQFGRNLIHAGPIVIQDILLDDFANTRGVSGPRTLSLKKRLVVSLLVLHHDFH